MADEDITQLWPYAADQFAHIPSLLGRFGTWKGVLTDSERSLAKEHGKLQRVLEEHEQALGAGSADILRSWQSYAQFFESAYASTDPMVTTAALRHLKTMKAELKKRLRGYEGELRKLKSNVMRHRGQTISSITAHERNLTKRASALKANSGVSPGVAHTADPWLSERVLHYQLRVMIAGENKFQEDVLALIRDMAAFDGRIVAQLRGVMDEFSAARTSQWNLMQTHISTSRALAAVADPVAHFQAFSSTHRLEEPKTWQHERTLDEFPYKVREIQILKHGLLHIPSRFSKNSWLPVVAVVTETGFFHCFKISSHKKLQLLEWSARQEQQQHQLRQQHDLDAAQNLSDQKQITHAEVGSGEGVTSQSTATRPPQQSRQAQQESSWSPFPSLQRTTGRLASSDVEPLGPEAVYKGLDHPSSAISISLSQSRMTIQLVPEKSHQHVFEIIIQHRRPRSGGLFSLWAKPTSDSWTRFEFKATTDNDLVEWLAVLQRKIQSYVPQGPPSPLFRSQQMIEQSVEAMIKEQHTRALTEIHSRESAPALAKFEPTIPGALVDNSQMPPGDFRAQSQQTLAQPSAYSLHGSSQEQSMQPPSQAVCQPSPAHMRHLTSPSLARAHPAGPRALGPAFDRRPGESVAARTLDSASTLVGTITKPAQSYGSASDALRDPVEQVKSLQASARLNASDSSLPTESGSQHFGQQLLAT